MSDDSNFTQEDRDNILTELQKEYNIVEDVSFNEFTLKDKLEKHPFLLIRYSEQLNREKFNYDQIKELYDKVVANCYDKYRFHYDEKLTQKEIEQYYLIKDEKVIKIKNILKKQNIRVQFFETCVKALDKLGWNMKNWLDRRSF